MARALTRRLLHKWPLLGLNPPLQVTNTVSRQCSHSVASHKTPHLSARRDHTRRVAYSGLKLVSASLARRVIDTLHR